MIVDFHPFTFFNLLPSFRLPPIWCQYRFYYLILSGRVAFAHFLQLAMISLAHFLRFQLRTIFTPQSGSISDKWACNDDLYRLTVQVKCVLSCFLDYAMDSMEKVFDPLNLPPFT